jgi:AcrR family transcriptional regulator
MPVSALCHHEMNISSLKKWIMIRLMVYRRTENVARRLAARREAIIAAAQALAAEGGMAAVQIAPVAARAGIAAGTVYRYFAAKTELAASVMAAVSERELAAMRAAADAAPGPLSALAATLTTFAGRALAHRRLAWGAIAEPVDPEIDVLRLAYRQALTAEVEKRLAAAIAAGHLPEQDARLSARALVGSLIEGLIGPLAPDAANSGAPRAAVQALTLFALRAVGIVDARARGLVVQSKIPEPDET